MSIRFIHAADIHLGYRQYNNDQRYDDFARIFERLVDETLTRRVDFLLLAGDLFHQRNIEPLTLLQASAPLQRLQAAGIPVIAIEGNHERPYYTEGYSWLDYLVEMDLLVLLNVEYREGSLVLDPWDGLRGAYIDLPCGARIIGAKYYGSTTGRVVQDLAQALPALQTRRPAYTVLMLHAGLEGILENYAATLRRSHLEPLRPYTDYLALGHIHKDFDRDGWIYNPGSLETNSVEEADWPGRSCLLVEVDTTRQPPQALVTPMRLPRRAFERLSFEVEAYQTPPQLHVALEAYVRDQATPARATQQPVVELQLRGRLAFNPADLDLGLVEELLDKAFRPLLTLVKNVTTSREDGPGDTADKTLQELELEVLRGLLANDAQYQPQCEQWARHVVELKRLALDNADPAEIIAELRAGPQLDAGDAPC